MLISSSSGTRAVPETARGMPSAIPSSESYVQSVQSMGKMSAVGDVETRKLKSTRGAAGVSFLSFRKLSVNDSHDLCLWVLFTVVCQVTSIIRQPETPAMSKASAKTVKVKADFIDCVFLPTHTISRAGIHLVRSWTWQREWRQASRYLLPHLPDLLPALWDRKPFLLPEERAPRRLMWRALRIRPLSPPRMRSYWK